MKNKRITSCFLLAAFVLSLFFGWIPSGISAYAEPETITVEGGGETVVTEEGGADNDALFAGYFQQLLFSASRRGNPVYGNDVLTGLDAAYYSVLRGYISETAAGTRASTEYTVTLDQLGLPTGGWSAAELGVDTVVVDGNITQEAVDALGTMVGCNLRAVNSALLADCPYDLYWFDKTAGTSGPAYRITGSYDAELGDFRIGVENETVTFRFPVAQGYSAGEYLVDTTAAQAAQTAASNAQAIVNEFAALDDDSKLEAYKDRICDLTAYNSSAAGDDSTPYGDPWQVIWVFDGDDTTDVVCEGYSKAFKYLCDMSTFEGAVSCILVSGTMDGGTGAGAHMWNVVNPSNGINYLVDVTNCDSGTIGYPDQLFMATPVSGSVDEGYTFDCGISYSYGDRTRETFPDEALAIGEMNGEVPFEYEIYQEAVTITGYTGTDGHIVIPSEIEGYPVTEIFELTCQNSIEGPITVVIPDSVTVMPQYLFNSWDQLVSAEIYADIETLPDGTFDCCGNLTTVVLSDSIRTIGEWAFAGCAGLESVQLPESLETIGRGAFSECGLTSFEVPSGVTSIGEDAFRRCSDLSSVILPSGLTEIKESVFTECTSLTSIEIPYGVTSIGQSAFNVCGLTSVVIPSSVTAIGQWAFANNYGLTSVLIPSGVTTIGQGAFSGCGNLTSVVIPAGVTSIGSNVFGEAYSLTEVYYFGTESEWEAFGVDTENNTLSDALHTLEHIEARQSNDCGDSYLDHYHCTICDARYLIENGWPVQVSEETVVFPSGQAHTPTEAWSCDENSHWHACAVCGDPVDPTDHVYDSPCDADCNVCGYVRQAPHEMETVQTETSHYSRCCLCGQETDPEEHRYSTACDEFCDVCGYWREVTHSYSTVWSHDGMHHWHECTECGERTDWGIHTGEEPSGEDPWVCEVCGAEYDGPISPFTYSFEDDGSAFISGYEGSDPEIALPAEIDGYQMTGIGGGAFSGNTILTSVVIPDGYAFIEANAFSNCSSLVSVELPDSLETIGYAAFSDCSSLTSVEIPDGVTSIGSYAFDFCSALISVEIPDSVTAIGEGAFRNCSSLTSIVLPNGITVIEDITFQNSGLTSVTIPAGVSSIGQAAFMECVNLTSVRIPDGVQTISGNLFMGCSSLTSVVIPASVTTIEHEAFFVNGDLTAYYLGGEQDWAAVSVGTWNDSLLNAELHTLEFVEASEPNGCMDGHIEHYYCASHEEYFILQNGWPTEVSEEDVLISSGLDHTPAEEWAFDDEGHWHACTVCGGRVDFAPHTGGTATQMSRAVCEICGAEYGELAEPLFRYRELEDGTIEIIGYNGSDTDLMIPAQIDGYTVKGIGENVFQFNETLRTVTICNGIEYIGNNAFAVCSCLTSVTMPDSMQTIADYAFLSCGSLTSIDLPDGLMGIGEGAFYQCNSLTSVVIPDSVTSLGSNAFSDCVNLTSIVLPSGLTEVPDDLLFECGAITSVVIPETVTSIGYRAFAQTGLTSVTIPSAVTEVGDCSFAFCSALTEITFLGNAPAFDGGEAFKNVTAVAFYPGNDATWTEAVRQNYGGSITWTASGNKPVFTEQLSDAAANAGETIMLVAEVSDALSYQWQYSTDNGETWTDCGDGTNGLVITADVTMNGRLYRCIASNNVGSTTSNSALLTVTDPSFVYQELDDGTLEITGYTGTDTVITIPARIDGKNVTKIGTRAFISKTQLTSVTIPEGVTAIGDQAFLSCSGLTTLVIPSSVRTLGNNSFSYCTSLTALTIPDGVTAIPNSMAQGCTALMTLVIPDSVKTIGEYAFSGCGMTSLVLQNGVESIGTCAFSNCKGLSSLAFPVSLTTIGGGAFNGCSGLTDVSFPDGLLTIENGAFTSCSSLSSLVIPASVSTLGEGAFAYCSSLQSVTFSGSAPAFGGSHVFDSVTATASYPGNDATWTEAVRQNYGGSITWTAYGSRPVITEQPADAAVDAGEIMLFVVNASDALSYQWQYSADGGETWTDCGEDANTLSFTAELSMNERLYRCIVSNYVGSTTSDSAFLRVVGTVSAPEITGHPADKAVVSGRSVTFSITATGDELTYQWQYSKDNGVNWLSLTADGSDTAVYTFTARTSMNGELYRCKVSNSAGSVTSDSAKLTVIGFTKQPANRTAADGTQVTFSVTANDPDLTYRWQYSDDGSTWTDCSADGSDTASFSFTAETSMDGRLFRCRVIHGASGLNLASASATLTVVGFTAQPADLTVSAGTEIAFEVEATGSPEFQWQYSKDNGETWTNCQSGAYNTKSFGFKATASMNGRLYRCVISKGSISIASGPAKLTVISKPAITEQPAAQTVVSGKNAVFTVTATGTDPAYQWQYSKDDGATWTNCSSTGSNTKSFSFNASTSMNGRLYRCKVSNSAGSVTSDSAKLTVTSGSTTKPAITTQPANKTVTAGKNVTFTVAATGTGLTYQWQYSKDGGTTWTNCKSGAYNTDTFSFEATASMNGRLYRCKVTNSAGSVTSNSAKLTVSSGSVTKPAITTQPANKSVTAGSRVTFSVKASGTDPAYQWQYSKDNGATWTNCKSGDYNKSAFSFDATASMNGRLYRCKVTNSAGSVTSNSAKLTVSSGSVTKPAITTQPANKSVTAGSRVTFSVKASGTDLTYQWQYSKDNGATWTNCKSGDYNKSAFSFDATASMNGRLYRCKVSNSAGEVTTNSAKLTVK